jgi:Immunity protein 8
MRAKLKELHSPDIDWDSYYPEDPTTFGFLLQAMIGIDGQEGDESFDIQVCSPEWLKKEYKKNDILFGRHLLIVFEYDKKRIESKISGYCERCFGENWQDLAEKLSRIGHWEFEDFTPYVKKWWQFWL